MSACDHCGLGVGRWGHKAETATGQRSFCCYGCFVAWQVSQGGGDDSDSALFLIRLGVGAFLSMNIMLFSLLHYSGAFNGLDIAVNDIAVNQAINVLLFALATPAVILLGWPFYKETFDALRNGKLVPSTLVALGTLSAYSYSALAVLNQSGRVYFDTAVMVLMLFTLGRYLEANSRANAARSLQPMLEAANQQVVLMRGAATERVPIASIMPGMSVQVDAGLRIPVDGRVERGTSYVEESLLTGEPNPVLKQPGSPVLAGSVNGEHCLVVNATTAGLDSQWIKICHDVRQALLTPTALQQVADAASVVFVPLVMALAVLAFCLHLDESGTGAALLAALAVLVVACPCALGLAAPLATSLGIVRLLEQGTLVRNGAVLETLASLRTIAFDKTGTLTTGQICCAAVYSSDPALDENTILQIAGAVACESRHPLALAVTRAISERRLSISPATDVAVVAGAGVKGCVQGQTIHLGNERWLQEQGVPIVHTLLDLAQQAAARGEMLAFVGCEGVCRSLITFSVTIHADASSLVSQLEKQYIDVLVITGDGRVQARRFCDAVGIAECHAELTPCDKQQALAEWAQRRAPVAMVGDGVNDALAMVEADVGIAVGSATDLARESADVVLPGNQVSKLLSLLVCARQTRKTIIINLLWAFAYNAVALVLALAGALQPVIAAALMAGSSLLVIANSVWHLGSRPT